MTRADWEAAVPKCPKGEVANIPGQICGEPLGYEPELTPNGDDQGGTWWCRAHGLQLSGSEAAARAGFAPNWVGAA